MILSLLIATAFAQSVLPAGLPAAVAAKVPATTFVLDEPDSWCTVSPITHDGYMITALHCVRSCLNAAGAGESSMNPFIGLQDIFVSTRSKTGGVNCPTLNIPALNVKGVTVVATGTALSVFDAHFMFDFPALYSELKSHGFASRTNDYAILKVAVAKPVACWPLGNAPAGSAIWALGYPMPNDSKQKPTLSASPGRVYANALESRNYAAAASTTDRDFINEMYSETGVLYSDAVTQFGQSGGPVISADGSLVGVISGFTSFGKPEVHELVATTADQVLRGLPPALASDLAQKTASCR